MILGALGAAALAAGCGPGYRRGGRAPAAATATAEPDAPPVSRADWERMEFRAWDLAIRMQPGVTAARDGEERLLVETVERGDLSAGVYELEVQVAPARAARGSGALARAAAEEWRHRAGADAYDPRPATFLGLPAHAFVFTYGDTSGLEVWTVRGRCVVSFVFLRRGDGEPMKRAAGAVLEELRPLAGEALDPPRCR